MADYNFSNNGTTQSFGAPTSENPLAYLDSILSFGQGQNGMNPNQFQNSGMLGVNGGNQQFGAPNTLGVGGTQAATLGAPAGMDTWGKAGVGIQGLSALLGGYMGLKQLGLAEDQLKFQKGAFNKNYANQVQTTNTQLEDRQIARVSGQGGAGAGPYQSVDDYMAKNQVG